MVISIQSQVAYGHVGNSAAVFSLQSRGVPVVSIPTALFANSPQYTSMRGQVLESSLVGELLKGLEERDLISEQTLILSGYLGSVKNGEVIAEFIQRAKSKYPRLTYICDPVVGDRHLGIFVEEGLLDFFSQSLVPLASILTPNHFELELLLGRRILRPEELLQAAATLKKQGAGHLVATGCVLEDSLPGSIETILAAEQKVHRLIKGLLPLRPIGTGDLFASILTSHLYHRASLLEAAQQATNEVHKILTTTLGRRSTELCIGVE